MLTQRPRERAERREGLKTLPYWRRRFATWKISRPRAAASEMALASVRSYVRVKRRTTSLWPAGSVS
jgi:hypothetical protein